MYGLRHERGGDRDGGRCRQQVVADMRFVKDGVRKRAAVWTAARAVRLKISNHAPPFPIDWRNFGRVVFRSTVAEPLPNGMGRKSHCAP